MRGERVGFEPDQTTIAARARKRTGIARSSKAFLAQPGLLDLPRRPLSAELPDLRRFHERTGANHGALHHLHPAVNADNVKYITAQANSIQGDFKKSVTSGSASGTLFQTERPAFATDNLEALLEQHNVPISATPPGSGGSPLLTLLLSFGPALLLIGGFLYLSRRMAGAGPGGFLGAFGQSKATLYTPDSGTRITFADVAGIEDAKQDLAEVVDFLKMPEKYQRLGAQIPHGILLVGAPGTGKTLLARAVAGESNRPCFSRPAPGFAQT